LGNDIVMVNLATLAGHVTLEDHSTLGWLTAVQPFVRVGAYAYIGAKTGVRKDIPPYVKVEGDKARLLGLNTIGLKRYDFSDETIEALKEAYQIVFRSHLILKEALKRIEKEVPSFPEVSHFVEFIRNSEQGITR